MQHIYRSICINIKHKTLKYIGMCFLQWQRCFVHIFMFNSMSYVSFKKNCKTVFFSCQKDIKSKIISITKKCTVYTYVIYVVVVVVLFNVHKYLDCLSAYILHKILYITLAYIDNTKILSNQQIFFCFFFREI